jgi:hypothetical protein
VDTLLALGYGILVFFTATWRVVQVLRHRGCVVEVGAGDFAIAVLGKLVFAFAQSTFGSSHFVKSCCGALASGRHRRLRKNFKTVLLLVIGEIWRTSQDSHILRNLGIC